MMNRILPYAVAASFALGASAAGAGDVAAGKEIFSRTCQNCHSIEIGVNKVGPSLWDVVGRPAASVPDYQYSEAMKANKAPWTAAALDAYLADPRADVHGVKMFFKGLHEPKDRADVIAYLVTLK
jgi:cytochrome c